MADRAAGVDRRSASATLTCADLFCGAGGFSEGFRQAGYRVTKALDIWAPAVITHERNLPDTEAIRADILSFAPERVGPVDVLIGSPPCTEFSFANRGGGGNVEAGMRLVYRFLRFVYELEPRWWVMENVPRVLDFLPDEIPLRKLGIDKKGSLEIPARRVVMSADYGTPQMRRRAFSGRFPLPATTHAESPREGLAAWRRLRDVVEMLPDPLSASQPGEAWRASSASAAPEVVRDPVYGLELPARELTDHFGADLVLTDEEVRQNRKAKADHSWYGRMSFPDELDRPARTVMATNLRIARETTVIPSSRGSSRSDGSPSGYRRLSVRECSSVQGFPITYQWWGATASLKYKLVGNAVAPPIAYAIARAIAAEARVTVPDRPHVVTRVTDPAPEATLARERRRALPLTRRFREHIPGSKIPGFRVDLDNRGTTPGRHLVEWRAVLYRGSGKGLSHRGVGLEDALGLLGLTVADDRTERQAKAFLAALERAFVRDVPDASTLQLIRAERETGDVTPHVLLERIGDLVDRRFDAAERVIRLDARRDPDFVPARIAATLVATAYVCAVTKASRRPALRLPVRRVRPGTRAHRRAVTI